MKSKPVKVCGKLFRYDFDEHIVEYVVKAGKDMRSDNKEWQRDHGKDLWDIDSDGYVVVDSAGLLPENWKDKEAREGYLSAWADDIDEEARCLADLFVKSELTRYRKEA